jgi:mRNA interferase HigB
MRVIARRTLREFIASRAGHQDLPALRAALNAWYYEVRRAHWKNTADVKRHYATASVVGADRVVFNIKGNSYRLVVHIKGNSYRLVVRSTSRKASCGSSGSARTGAMTASMRNR